MGACEKIFYQATSIYDKFPRPLRIGFVQLTLNIRGTYEGGVSGRKQPVRWRPPSRGNRSLSTVLRVCTPEFQTVAHYREVEADGEKMRGDGHSLRLGTAS